MPLELDIPDFDYEIITDPGDIPEVLNELDKHPEIAYDCETTGLDFIRDDTHGIGLATQDKAWYVCRDAYPAIMENLGEIFRTRVVAGHNIKFDMHFTGRKGVLPVPEKTFDTQVAQWLIDENQRSLKLKNLGRTKLGIRNKLPEFKDLLIQTKGIVDKSKYSEVLIEEIPLEDLGMYGAFDARLTFDLMQKSKYELAQEGMKEIFHEFEMPFLHVLYDMERVGMPIDVAATEQLLDEFQAEVDELLERWDKKTGGVNPRSWPQLQELLYEEWGFPVTRKTKTGNPSTDRIALMRLQDQDETGAIKDLLAAKKLDKVISTYLTSFLEKHVNGVIHGSFNQTGTVSGRLSSSGPNLQNIPSRGELGKKIRSLFIALPGYTLVVLDYSQIELRLLAHYTRDPKLVEIFKTGADPHQTTADLIKETTGAEIERFAGKTTNYLWQYGGGPRMLADTIEEMGYPRPEESNTKLWLEGFDLGYAVASQQWRPRVYKWGKKLGYVKTIMGRKRRLPDLGILPQTTSDWRKLSRAERQAISSIIQGSAGDIINHTMLDLHSVRGWFGSKLISQVHDENVFMVPDEVVEEFVPYARERMESVKDVFNISVPIEVDGGAGADWSSAK